jgi:hypothetical protein
MRLFRLGFVLCLAGCAAAHPPAKPAISAQPKPVPARATRVEPLTQEQQKLHAAIQASLVAPDPSTLPPLPPSDDPVAPLPALVRDGTPVLPPPSPDGSRLPPEAIRRVLRLSAGRFKECYLHSSWRHRDGGKVSVRFEIGPDGRVWKVQEENVTLPNRELRHCLLSRLFELEFPSPGRQTIVVRYPWSLGAPDGPDRMPDATRIAEPPPPGFEEAMQLGISVAPPLPPDPKAPVRVEKPTRCVSGDPMCAEL